MRLVAWRGKLGGVEVVAENGSDTESADGFEGRCTGARSCLPRSGRGVRRERGEVEQGVVEDAAPGMVEDGLDVLRGCEAGALVGLGHEIADVDAYGVGAGRWLRGHHGPAGSECNW